MSYTEEIKQMLNDVRLAEKEFPYIEVKESLQDVKKLGETFSAIYNSALYFDKPFAYMIWGVENNTWKVKGTKFDIHKDGILNQILKACNIKPEIHAETLEIDRKRIFAVRIKPIIGQILSINNVAYIRNESHNSKLLDYPEILNRIISRAKDWSAESEKLFSINMIDSTAYDYLFEMYFSLERNITGDKSISKINFLNKLGLLNEKQLPNNTCILFLGKAEILEKYFPDKVKIAWKYKDDKNDIEERLHLEESRQPFILLIPRVLDEINRFNTPITELSLFRKDIRQYDRKILEEALINAVVHRDWTINLWIEILQTPDTLEIKSDCLELI